MSYRSFRPIFLIPSQADAYHIARYSTFNKDHLAVYLCQGLALGSIIAHLNSFQNYIFFFSCHRPKVRPPEGNKKS